MVKEKGLGLLKDSVALGYGAPLILGQRLHRMSHRWEKHSQNKMGSKIKIGECRIGHPNKFYTYSTYHLFVIVLADLFSYLIVAPCAKCEHGFRASF